MKKKFSSTNISYYIFIDIILIQSSCLCMNSLTVCKISGYFAKTFHYAVFHLAIGEIEGIFCTEFTEKHGIITI